MSAPGTSAVPPRGTPGVGGPDGKNGDDAPERRLHPWSWLFVLLQQLRQFIVPLLVLVFAGRGDRNGLWPLIGVGVLALTSALQYFTYRYRIGAEGIRIRSGWVHRTVREIPFARLHDVAVHQSMLHRLFGVAEVRLESAGGVRPEAQMRVLALEDALALEDLVRQRGEAGSAAIRTEGAPTATVPGNAAVDAGGSQGAEDARAVPESARPAHVRGHGETLLTLPTAEVVRLGLASNRGMVVVAGAFAVAWQVVPESMFKDGLRQLAGEAFGYAGHLHAGWIAALATAAAALLAAWLALRLLSVALALVQYHGFRLSEDHHRLTVERGLLTRLRNSAPRRRIQAWTLRETALLRWLRRRSLAVDTAAAPAGEQQASMKELAPIAAPDACDALIRRLLPGARWPRETWLPLSGSAGWRLFLPGAVTATALAAAACAWLDSAWGLAALAWLPWGGYAAGQHARRAGYDLDDRLVAVRGGWWSRHWRFAEIDKLQALRLSRSPLDRRCGTATLWLDTAGADPFAPPLRIRFLPQAEARALYERLGHAVAARRLRW